MRQKIVREGNAFYEIDDECMRKKRRAKEEKRIPAKRQHILQKRTLKSPRQQAGEYL